jgi:hypothetical protein
MKANYPLTHRKMISPAFLLAVITVIIMINYIVIVCFIQASTLTSPVQAAEQRLSGRTSQPRLPAMRPMPVPTPPNAANPPTATPTPAPFLTVQSQASPLALQPMPVPTPPVR